MKLSSSGKNKGESGSALIFYCIIAASILLAIGGLAYLVSGSTIITGRRGNVVSAQQFAQGGVVIACRDLNTALTNGSGTIASQLVSGPTPYTRMASLSTASTDVYQRTIAAPFDNQTVVAQIWLPAGSSPNSAKIVASAQVGPVTQTATANIKMNWGYPAAIVSVNAGLASVTSINKTTAQDGNVVINGSKSGPIVVDGGVSGLAVLANGAVVYDTNYTNPPKSAYSQTNQGSANQIPDYTAQGTSNTLFDIGRFIAVADLTPEPTNFNPTANNHFTNLTTFINAAKMATNSAHSMEGVIVVDVSSSDSQLKNLTDSVLPNGINIKGTWLMNFTGSGWDPTTEKIIVSAAININPADLSHLVATDPTTYTSGYPPIYSDPTKNPTNININASTNLAINAKGYANFTAADDLPAEIYTIGVLDMHGNANISGVLYTPSYMEIENKTSGNTQYIRGSLIMGNGIYDENLQSSTSIISFDANAVDSLSTIGGVGKKVLVTYWQ
jgi:hypothetical protein